MNEHYESPKDKLRREIISRLRSSDLFDDNIVGEVEKALSSDATFTKLVDDAVKTSGEVTPVVVREWREIIISDTETAREYLKSAPLQPSASAGRDIIYGNKVSSVITFNIETTRKKVRKIFEEIERAGYANEEVKQLVDEVGKESKPKKIKILINKLADWVKSNKIPLSHVALSILSELIECEIKP